MEQRSLGTHDGSFHADEVTACSLLLLFGLIDRNQIRRTRDMKVLGRCAFVCDVGGKYDPAARRFDHHQAEYQGTMSSAGMVLLYLKEQRFIEPHLYDYFNKSLVMGVDAHDNGVAKLEQGVTSFSQVISNFMPIEYDASSEAMDQAFFQGGFESFRDLDAHRLGIGEVDPLLAGIGHLGDEAAGEFPNLGLMIRDALYEYVRRAAEDAEGRK